MLWSVAAAVRISGALVGLGTQKVREHVRVVPAGTTRLGPAIEVAGVAAHPEHAVDGTAPAEHLARGPMVDGAVPGRIRFGLVTPVVLLLEPHQSRRYVDVRGHVVRPRFEHKDAVRPVGGQAVGQHATRGASADDHVVERRVAIVVRDLKPGGRRPTRSRGMPCVWSSIAATRRAALRGGEQRRGTARCRRFRDGHQREPGTSR